ncbi:MAG: hypothetical protein ACK4VO_08485 [Pseudobdellovibrio sp.]
MRRAVVDQSGLKIVVTGIIISVFIGLIFKSQIRPNIVKQRLEKTLVKLQKDINIDFESVDVQLSEWGIPRPVVAINGIRISPLSTSCNENQIYIESLSFPLSFNLLLSENKTINSLRMSLVEVRIKHLDQCIKASAEKKSVDRLNTGIDSSESESSSRNKSTVQFDKVIRHSNTHLKDVNIDRLRIISPDNLKTAIDFNAVQMNLGYNKDQLSSLLFQSQMLMFKDPNRNLYLLKSDARMHLEINAQNFLSIDADIAGLILDRPLKVKIKTDAEKKVINLFGEFKSVSLKALNYLVRSENRDIEVYDFLSGSTISGFLTGEYSIEKQVGDLFLSKVKILFGGGSLDVNDIHLTSSSGSGWVLKPFDVEISRVDLTKIVEHPYFARVKSSVQNAGFLSGLLQFDAHRRFKLNALLEKGSFYFSNKGLRLNQTFDRFNLKLIADQQKLDLTADDFIYNGKKILGRIHYSQNKINTAQLLTADLKGEILSQDIVKLFTGQSYQPIMSLSFQTDLKTKLFGKGSLNRFDMENMSMNDVTIDYNKDLSQQKEEILIKAQTVKITHMPDEEYFLNQFFKPSIFTDSVLDMQSARIEIEKNKNIDVQFKADAEVKNLAKIKIDRIKLNGVIDDKLFIRGSLGLKSLNKKNSTFSFSGVYDQLNILSEN